MELQYRDLLHAVQTAAVAALIFAICSILPKLKQQSYLARFPVVGGSSSGEKQRQAFLTSAKQMYLDGYRKFKDSAYRMASGDEENYIVIPTNLLPELKKLPDDVLSFPRAMDDAIELKHTKIDVDSGLVNHSVRSYLTPALARVNDSVKDEVDRSVEKHVPECNTWTELNVYSTLANIVAQVSGRVFVGSTLCQDPEYLDCAVNYAVDIMDTVTSLKGLRPWTKFFMGHRLPAVLRLRQREKKLAEVITPLIRQRQEAAKADPHWEKPDDVTQWMLERHAKDNIPLETVIRGQLALIFAAIHTTTMTATNIFYSLASTPEYIDPIREEVRSVLAENDDKLNMKSLQQMEKLDSYMKEVNRFFPGTTTSFNRRVLKGITLSNGQYLPPGVIVEAPSYGVYGDSAHYPDSETFDGYRHYKLRRNGGATDHARNQFVTVNEQNMIFGYGRHACPGRFFAANEIKMIVANIILNYDIKMPDGLTERYAQIELKQSISPDPTKKLLFKKVGAA